MRAMIQLTKRHGALGGRMWRLDHSIRGAAVFNFIQTPSGQECRLLPARRYRKANAPRFNRCFARFSHRAVKAVLFEIEPWHDPSKPAISFG
jgi:hypothetical protein